MPTFQRTAAFPDWDIEVEDDGHIVTGGREFDPAWRYVDTNGHGHFTKSDTLPTLEWVPVPCTMDHGEDCTSEGDWHCRTCGEVVEPGTRASAPQYVPGPTTYTLTERTHDERDETTTVYQFGESEWDRLNEALGGILLLTLPGCVRSTHTTGSPR